MRDGIRLYWDRDETAIAATAKKFKDCEDAEECGTKLRDFSMQCLRYPLMND